MIDIKLRNVKVEDADTAIWYVGNFMKLYSGRRGFRNGVGYTYAYTKRIKFYVYRTDKTVICVGDYGSVDK